MRLPSGPFLPAVILLVLVLVSIQILPVAAIAQSTHVPVDTTIVSEHRATINGQTFSYTREFGFQPAYGDDGKPIAALQYTYYTRNGIEDTDVRPLVISFNGGPGSASLWMHIGYTGPQQLVIDDEGYPVRPYGVRDNPSSILDAADIVFVNPVNTGLSRALPDVDDKQFFGVNEDIAYLAKWINTFVNRKERWPSPKFLIGESYGTTRVSGLANRLQNSHWMYLNGIILVSPTGLGVARSGPVSDALYLPYFTATAWYHGQLPPDLQQQDLDDLLPVVEAYTIDTVLPALARGGSLPESERRELAAEMARWSGLTAETLLEHNLRVSTSFFWKELLRDEGLTVGRLDSRYRGKDAVDAGERYDFDPALTAWNHAFAPAINHYIHTEIGFKTDVQYNLFGPVSPWNRSSDRTGENLRQAMAQNPWLHVLVQSGYFDGGTDYFNAKYTMWNLDERGRFQDRMQFIGYRSGHMMYLRAEDLVTSNEDIRSFIRQALEAASVPARY